MIDDLKHPIRREFMIASLEEIKTEEDMIVEFLNKHFEHLAEHLVNILDIHGTSMVNVWSKKKIKHIFSQRGRRKQFQNVLYGDFVKLPDGRVIKTS